MRQIATSILLGFLLAVTAPAVTAEPSRDRIFTSTGEVLGLAPAPGNQVWAATSGGLVIVKAVTGKRFKWDRMSGLPSNEVQAVARTSGGLKVWTPLGTAVYDSGAQNWVAGEAEKAPARLAPVIWRGTQASVTLDGLQFGTRLVPMPKASPGTHITSLLPGGDHLLIAIYGDGFWEWNGVNWRRSTTSRALPPEAREITCAARLDAKSPLWVGTRRRGVFWFWKGRWKHSVASDEPYNHNVQYFAAYGSTLFASTLDDGLISYRDGKWGHAGTPTISSNAARQMATFGDAFYVRHGDGYVDRLLGKRWMKNVFPQLPRGKVLAMDADADHLYLAQWGGWSEWDGTKFEHHFDVEAIRNIPLVGITAGKQYLWLMTQSRGVIRWDRSSKEAIQFDTRRGLPDEWVTAVVEAGSNVYAGTFTGGVARWNGERWETYAELKGECITGLAADGDGASVATRHGLWRVEGSEARKYSASWADEELQAVHRSRKGIWIGARTSVRWMILE